MNPSSALMRSFQLVLKGCSLDQLNPDSEIGGIVLGTGWR